MTKMRSLANLTSEHPTHGVPGRQYPVHIKEVVPVADPITQPFQVRFEMKPPFGVTVVPGMTASVSVKYETSLGSDGTPVTISSPCIPDPRQR
jgi:hypothetical protein